MNAIFLFEKTINFYHFLNSATASSVKFVHDDYTSDNDWIFSLNESTH